MSSNTSQQVYRRPRRALVSVLIGLMMHIGMAQTLDEGFNPEFDNTSSVPSGRAIARQADGRIIVAGAFESANGVARGRIARLNLDGSLDPSFDPGTGFNAPVNGLALQVDGRVLAVGEFTEFDGTPANRLVRLNADGSLDDSFATGAGLDDTARRVQLQADGRVLVAGLFQTASGQPRAAIARYLSSGALDSTFIGPGSLTPTSLARLDALVQDPDGRQYVGGDFSSVSGQPFGNLVRLMPDGTLDTSFDSSNGPDGRVLDLALLADGRLVVAGSFQTLFGVARQGVAIVREDASVDPAFELNVPFNGQAHAVAVQDNGQLLIGGSFFTSAGNGSLIRVDPFGQVDAAFDQQVSGGFTVEDLWLEPNQDILFSGTLGAPNSQFRDVIARFARDGQLDQAFSRDFRVDGFVNAMARQAGNRLIIGGDFLTQDATPSQNITSLLSDGSLDLLYQSGTGAGPVVYQVVATDQGDTLVASTLNQYDGETVKGVFRLLGDGSLDPSLDPALQVSDIVQTVAPYPDGRMLLGGEMDGLASAPIGNVARLMADGSLDPSFDAMAVPSGSVTAVVLQPDGRILIAGSFIQVAGVSRRRIARLNADGSLDASFDPGTGASSTVSRIDLLPDGRMLITGGFFQYNDQVVDGIAMLEADGSLDASFNPDTNATVFTTLPLANGQILIGGSFSFVNGEPRATLAVLNADGTLDLQSDAEFSTSQLSLIVDASIHGKVTVAGQFEMAAGISSPNLARFRLKQPASQTLTQASDRITWLLGGSMPMPSQVSIEQSTDGIDYSPLAEASWTGDRWQADGVVLEAGWSWLRMIGRKAPNVPIIYDHYLYALPEMVVDQTALAFGSLLIGDAAQQSVLIENQGDALLVATVSLSNASFAIIGGSCDPSLLMLAPQESCSLQIQFSPLERGLLSETLQLTPTSELDPVLIALGGTGLGIELAGPEGGVDFGRWPPGTVSTEQQVTIFNIGDFAATVSGLVIAGQHPADFMIVPGSDTCTGTTLQLAEQCTVDLVFAAMGQGPRRADLQVLSNAFNSPTAVSLEGNSGEIFMDGFESDLP